MLIALLVVRGVDLIVVVAFVLGRRRWLKRQPGEFAGRIRVSSGDVDGLSRVSNSRWVPEFGDGCLPTRFCLDQGV